MPSTIKLRRGDAASLPILNNGEPAIALDTQTLYYGTGTVNINLTPIRWIGTTPEYPSGSNTIGRYTLNIVSPLVENYNAVDLRAYIAGGVKMDQMGAYSFACGYGTKAQGGHSFAANKNNIAQGGSSFVTGEGNTTDANAHYCLVGGQNNIVYNLGSFCVGKQNSVMAMCGLASGSNLTCESFLQTSLGQYNVAGGGGSSASLFSTESNALVIGNGASASTKSNCFRVKFNGSVYGIGAYNSSGADYAEYFEWVDGNPKDEDRVGRFVKLSNGNKIAIASWTEEAEILGVVSHTGAIIGNSHSENWNQMYLKDSFGRVITETRVLEDGSTVVLPKINPSYNPSETYLPRENRKEWDPIGLLGRLRVRDDGSCTPGQHCICGANGIAINSSTGYKVLTRISTNVVEILIK